MSLIINSTLHFPIRGPDGDPENQRDLINLDRYLAIIENNKKSSRFVPNDAMLALDMAGFVRGQLHTKAKTRPVSTARLALALVQPCVTVQ